MNTFEGNLLEDWSTCTALLSLNSLDEFERRVHALIRLMELCLERTWLVPTC
jgi:hypothetical protein